MTIWIDWHDWVGLFWNDVTHWSWFVGCWAWSFIWHFHWGPWTRARAEVGLAESLASREKCRSQCPACKKCLVKWMFCVSVICFLLTASWFQVTLLSERKAEVFEHPGASNVAWNILSKPAALVRCLGDWMRGWAARVLSLRVLCH